MSERFGKWSAGVEIRHPVTMLKASILILSCSVDQRLKRNKVTKEREPSVQFYHKILPSEQNGKSISLL